MIITVRWLLFLAAFICFMLATFNIPKSGTRINLTDLGLAFLTLALWGVAG